LISLGVVAALAAEARALGRSASAARASGSFGNLKILSDGSLVAVSGMGARAAAAAAHSLIEAGVASLMTFGVAGGLDPALSAGTLLLPEQIASPDGRCLSTSEAWCRQLRATLGEKTFAGTLFTSELPVDSVDAKSRTFTQTGALAVDMESFAVAEVAAEHCIPFVALRAIVDTALDSLPRSVMAASSEGGVRISKLLVNLARSPQELPALLRLSSRYRLAMRALSFAARRGSLAFQG
jgi:adenosylhomocysteine nucleosidase